MPKNKKKNPKPGKKRRIVLMALGGVVLALAIALACFGFAANTVHVRYATVTLEDLPESFDGLRILYAADIDLCGINSPEKAGQLFGDLQKLSPDILLLGGDYTSVHVFDAFSDGAGSAANLEKQMKARSDFFLYIRDFQAPLGKYAIASPDDPDVRALQLTMDSAGVMLLDDPVAIERDGAQLHLVGVSASVGMQDTARQFRKGDCVLTMAYSPEVFPMLLTAEARDSGRWFDVALAGHTHGGQLRLFGKSMLSLTDRERQYLYGWTRDNDAWLLTTSGVGCESVNLRAGSAAEVWLITLKRPEADPEAMWTQ